MQKVLEGVKKHRKLAVLALVLVILAVGSAIIFWPDKKVEPVIDSGITYSTDNPDESLDNAKNYKWQGAPEEPKKITIPKISVDTFVQKSGIDQNKRMAVPNNVHLASWWGESAKPGQPGYSVVAAHVSGKTMPGAFKDLGKIVKGDKFSVELGNGQIKNYEVINTITVKEDKSAAQLYTQDPSVKSQMNLITCGGKFDRTKGQYEDRIIVWGKLF